MTSEAGTQDRRPQRAPTGARSYIEEAHDQSSRFSKPRPHGRGRPASRGPRRRDLGRSADFYGRILGLAEVGGGPVPVAGSGDPGAARQRRAGSGTTRDDPAASSPSSSARRATGAAGIGGSHHFALGVADREALLMWKRRFLDEGYAVNGILDRHYFQSIYVQATRTAQIVELATRGPGWTRDEEAATTSARSIGTRRPR